MQGLIVITALVVGVLAASAFLVRARSLLRDARFVMTVVDVEYAKREAIGQVRQEVRSAMREISRRDPA